MSKLRLENIIDGMEHIKVLVIGDVMLDEYEWCEVKRISPEAPVPVASVKESSQFLGGAGNVAHNAVSLQAQVSLISVIGDDVKGENIREMLTMKGIGCDGLVVEVGRKTTVKQRIMADSQQLLRIDREATHDIAFGTEETLFTIINAQVASHDIVVISDYCKGMITSRVAEYIKSVALTHNKKVVVDSKDQHLPKYAGVYLIKPNKEEAEYFAKEKFMHDFSNLENVGKSLRDVFQSNVVITLGGDGIALFEKDYFLHKRTTAKQVFDVSGAGDTVLAVIATALASGASLDDAVHIANIAAGHVVSRLGTAVCERHELKTYITVDV